MALIVPREPENFAFAHPQQAVDQISTLHNTGATVRCLDAADQAIRMFPDLGIPFLGLAWTIYQTMSDRSRYALYQSRVFDFGIKPGDKVLDMGSGHIPFPLATHLADISLSDGGIGRAGIAFKPVDGKPTFECDIEHTPFADKEFDFVYCSHVLEHAGNPAQACRELMRIARRGYIETPNKAKDMFMGSARVSNHLNYVELVNGVLRFERYEAWQLDGIGSDILQQMHAAPQTEREKAFSALLYLRPRAFNTMLLWEDTFDFSAW